MSPDLKIATAFVAPLGAADDEAVVEALNRNARFIRGRMSPALRQMKYMPEFRFRLDTSYDNMARIDELLRSPEVARDLDKDEEGRRLMARRGKKKGRPVSGWLVLDKPVGMGSTEAVSKIKWLFKAEKAGHAGTLDPLASGMLPIALGEATKTVPYVHGRHQGLPLHRRLGRGAHDRRSGGPGDADLRQAARRGRDPRAAAELYRRHHAGAAAILGDQDRRRARLRSRPRRRDGRDPAARGRDRPPRPGRDRPRRAMPSSRSNAARAPMCARWRATWGAISAASAMSPGCAGSRSSRSRRGRLVTPGRAGGRASPSATRPDGEAAVRGDRFAALDALLVDTGAALECLPQVALTDDAAARIRLGNPVIMRGRDAPRRGRRGLRHWRAAGWSPSARSKPACSSRSGFSPASRVELVVASCRTMSNS